jgi:hypothetical protein
MTIIETHFGVDMDILLRQEMQETYYMIQCNGDFCRQRFAEQGEYIAGVSANELNLPEVRVMELITSATNMIIYWDSKVKYYNNLLDEYKSLPISKKREVHLEYRTKLLPILIY